MTRAFRMTRTVVAVHLCVALLLPAASCLGERKLHRNKTNALQIFDIFPDGVAIYTSSNDPSLMCVTADRTEYKPNGKVVYTWNLNSGKESKKDTHVVEYYPGPAPDTVVAIANHVCILWVPKAYVSSVPQECVDQFEDICDEEVPAYQEGLCDDALGG
ncbi:uncharacterized protein LOC142564809 isoform X2 [Dermacentor variabilis]|uniref:uncharacterized protein LOC142564809 isoform X2 n=1 Tax=Dermacentor variabilis TaxID=34621 RepID=UPI003F5C16B5